MAINLSVRNSTSHTQVMFSGYTANLAAFLTFERSQVAIRSAKDLAAQTEIKYGCYRGGSTCYFFEKSNIELYQVGRAVFLLNYFTLKI